MCIRNNVHVGKLFAMILLIALSLTSCIIGSGGTTTPPEPDRLYSPDIVLEGDTVLWEENELAVKYEISINGVLSYIESSVTSWTLEDGETFKIRAIGDGYDYVDSPWSKSVTYKADEGSDTPELEYYTVIWKNENTVLETDTNVPEGSIPEYNAETPTKPNCAFIGWSPEVGEIYEDTVYQAQFVSMSPLKYIVLFKDYDGTVLKWETVEHGNSATPPADPEREGYTFTGWDGDYTNITTPNVVITATYAENKPDTYTVIFKDHDGTVLKTETVESGKSATAPEEPTREGYTFAGWDGDYTNVTADQIITAIYEENIVGDTYTVTFVDYDGITVLGTDIVVSGGMANLPTNPTRSGYIFAGWYGVYKNVTSDKTVQAQYISEDASNIFLIDSATANVGDTFTIQLNLTGTVKLLTFDMCLYYDTSVLEVVSYDDQEVTINHLEEGMFILNHSQDKNRTKDKYLTEITFRVKAGATVSSTQIYISDAKDIVYVNDGGTYSDADYELISGLVRIQ